MFFFRRTKTRLIHGSSPGEQFLRFVALIAVFITVAWLFWQHSANNMEKIKAMGTVVDNTNSLNKEQRGDLRNFAKLFKSEFGFSVKIVINNDMDSTPLLDSKTIFYGVNPSTQSVFVEFPPLLRKAVGKNFLHKLRTEHFPPYFTANKWPEGLLMALKLTWDSITDVENEVNNSE